ncbi:transcriptional regulator [Desulfocarbo indianensis]|nr:transcriptional regulator [Desulfocarbo indianensis]
MERRQTILDMLRRRDGTLTGAELALRLGVSRQIIVQDIALLRAEGHPILATPQGYFLQAAPQASARRAVIAVRHAPPETQAELSLLVTHGLTVLDVIVEHPLYGELRGNLMLKSLQDVESFIARVERGRTPLLSSLTKGVHLHTVEYRKAGDLTRAQGELAQHGFLVVE